MSSIENKVAERRAEVVEAVARGRVVQDLKGGTPGMAAAGERYIPKREGEPDAKWKARVADAVLHNVYARTVAYLTGQVFARDVSLGMDGDGGDKRDLSDLFQSVSDDADLQGNNLSVFAAKFFAGALDDGARLLLVEFPKVETRKADGGRLEYLDESGQWLPKTAEADARKGWRPYFVAIELADILGWRMERVNGRQVLTQLRFKEKALLNRGRFDTADEYVSQIRVLEPGKWSVWRETKGSDGKPSGHYEEAESGSTTPMDEIPVALFMPGPLIGGLAARPALEDLAHLNRRHWQAQAEHNELMRWVRAPGMYAVGIEEGATLPWGPGIMSRFTDPNGKIVPVGVDSPSVAASRQELKDLEEQMALFGLQLLIPQTGDATATAKALDAAESDSTLKRWALGLRDCLNQALLFAAKWVGVDETQVPVAAVNTDFHPLANADPAVIISAVEKGVFSKELAFNEFRRRGLAPDGLDWPQVLEQLQAEESLAAAAADGPSLAADAASRLLGQGQ